MVVLRWSSSGLVESERYGKDFGEGLGSEFGSVLRLRRELVERKRDGQAFECSIGIRGFMFGIRGSTRRRIMVVMPGLIEGERNR